MSHVQLERDSDRYHDNVDTSFIEEGLNALMQESLLIAYEPEKAPRHNHKTTVPLPSTPVLHHPQQSPALSVTWLLLALLLLTGAIGSTFWFLQGDTGAGKDRNSTVVKQTRGGTNNFSGMPARMP